MDALNIIVHNSATQLEMTSLCLNFWDSWIFLAAGLIPLTLVVHLQQTFMRFNTHPGLEARAWLSSSPLSPWLFSDWTNPLESIVHQ